MSFLDKTGLLRLWEHIVSITNTKVDKIDGKGLSTNDYTTVEKSKLAGIASGAEVNQNAFSNIKVGTTTISADTKTDTLTLTGSNVTITPNATSDSVTFAVGIAGSSLGLVKSGGDVTISNGVITVDDDSHNHTIANIDNLQSSLDAKVPISRTINGKALSANIILSASDVNTYTKTEIDNMELITVEDIDTICGSSIVSASEVSF